MRYRPQTFPGRPPRADRRPLLSVCTILILSGFLLGISIGTQLDGELRVLVSIAGMAGLVAFVGLDHVAARRQLQAERDEQAYVENRLRKHLELIQTAAANDQELLALAREATAMIEIEDFQPAGSSV